jgi:PAS domain S-box-containing protein
LKNQTEISAGGALDFNILFNLSDHPQCILNPLGYFETLNNKFAEESGLTEAELFAGSFSDIIHPDDTIELNQAVLTANRGGIAEFKARLFHCKHSYKAFLWKATLSEGNLYLVGNKIKDPVPLAHKFVQTAVLSITPDSTLSELSSVEVEASTQNEHRFKTLVQNGTDLLAILSIEGEYKYISPTVKRILGFDPEYYLGKNVFSFIHPDDINRLLPLFENIVQNIKIDLPAYRFISADGKWHWLETVATNLLHDPTIKGIVVNSRDITLHKEMQSDILRNSRKFSNLIEHNKDGSFILSKDWRFTFLNSVIRNTPELPKGLTVGVNIWKVIPNAINTAFYSEFQRAFAENTPVHFKEFSPLFNKWFEVNAYPFEDSLTVMIRDITEQKIQQLTLSLEKEVLEMTAASTYSLKQLSDHLMSGFEKIHAGLKASLSIVDKETNKLVPLSVPSITGLYKMNSEGVEIASGSGPCSLAALNHTEVYISNILTDEIVANFRDALLTHKITSSLSLPVIDKNGEVLAVFTLFNSGHRRLLKTGTGLIQRLGTIIQLLLENNQAKKDIEISNERYQLTTQATSDSIWDLDLKSQKLYRGDGFDKYFDQQPGFEPIELRKWEHNIHPEDTERVDSSLERALEDSSTTKWTAEYRYLKKDGSYAWIIDKGFIVRDKEKQAVRIVGAVQDISEIRKSQEKLIQSEENYKNMFFNNPTPMWTYDMESERFTMVNAAALALYGYTEEEFLQLDLLSIRVEEEHEKLREHLKSEAFLTDRNVSNEWTHLRKDKSAMIVDVVSHAVLINGRRSRLVAIKDITDKKKDRQEILGQNKRLREIAQISSHETRKPLASILGLVNLFDKENLNNPLNKEIIQYLDVTANELDTVIHNIVRKTWLESETSSAFPE